MTLKKHVNKVINRVTNRVKQLTSTFLTNKAALLVYKNMILLVMEHGYIFLSAATKANRDKLQTLQNKALHIIHNVDKYHNSEILQKESNLMRLKHRREIHLHNFMFTLKDDLRMKKAGGRLGVKTRSSKKMNFSLRKPNTEQYRKCVSYHGPKQWNKLPVSVQLVADKRMFRFLVTKHVMTKAEKTAENTQPNT